MIVVKLIGGLGNQMYQYAYGLQLAAEYGEAICFDTSFYPSDASLALYNLGVPVHPLWQDAGISGFERFRVKLLQKSFHVLQKAIRIFGRTDRTGNILYCPMAKHGFLFNFDPYYYHIPKCSAKNKYVYGYFQGAQYFSDSVPLLKEQFVVRHTLSEEAKQYENEIRNSNAVALHIRLGDYTNAANTDLNVCTQAYYRHAIEHMERHVANPTYYVFTNDVQGAAAFLPSDKARFVFVKTRKDYEDFALMKQCRHFILSNSTFSWWAAFLAESKDKIMTVPEKWRHSQIDEPAIYLPNMTKLPID